MPLAFNLNFKPPYLGTRAGGRVSQGHCGPRASCDVPNMKERMRSHLPTLNALHLTKDPLPKLAGRPQTPNTPTRAKNLEILTATSQSALHLPH